MENSPFIGPHGRYCKRAICHDFPPHFNYLILINIPPFLPNAFLPTQDSTSTL